MLSRRRARPNGHRHPPPISATLSHNRVRDAHQQVTSTFRDACPSRVRGCRSAIRRLSEFVSEPCPTVSERLRGVRAVARLCLVCEGTPRITSDNQPCPRTCLGCPSLSERVLAHPTVSERKLFMYSFLSLTLPYTHSTPTTRTLC